MKEEEKEGHTNTSFEKKPDILQRVMDIAGITSIDMDMDVIEMEEIDCPEMQQQSIFFKKCSSTLCPFPLQKDVTFVPCFVTHISSLHKQKKHLEKVKLILCFSTKSFSIFFHVFQMFGSRELDLTVQTVLSLLPGQKVSNLVMDSYASLANKQRIKDYYVLPSYVPKFRKAKKNVFTSFEIKNLKWLLYPSLANNHWILFAFKIKSQRTYIFNSAASVTILEKDIR